MNKALFSFLLLTSLSATAGEVTTKNISCFLSRGAYKSGPQLQLATISERTQSYSKDKFSQFSYQDEQKQNVVYAISGEITETRVSVQSAKDDPDRSPEVEVSLHSQDANHYTGTIVIQGWFYDANCLRKDEKLTYPDSTPAPKQECPWGDDPDC